MNIHTAACIVLAPIVATFTSIAADQQAEPITVMCPEMGYHLTPAVDVEVERDNGSDEYIYRYTLRANKSDRQVPYSFMLADIAEGRLVSGFASWPLCNYNVKLKHSGPDVVCVNSLSVSKSEWSGLEIRSRHAPGYVTYRVEGRSTKPLVDRESAERLHRLIADDAALSESLQEQIGEQCASGRVKSDTERKMTGVTLGPTEVASLVLAIEQPTAQRSAEIHLVVRGDDVQLSNVDMASLIVVDSIGHRVPIQASDSPTADRDGKPVLRLKALPPSGELPCNAKGILLKGQLIDGRDFRAGAGVPGAPCENVPESFTFSTVTAVN